jgi:hypothetical protein
LSKPDSPYKQIFREHRLLLSAPVVIALFISLWTVVGAQKSYQSTASLWVDNAPPAASSVTATDPTLRPPAAQQQLVLNELVATRDFRLTVAHKGPLATFLASNHTGGFGPMTLIKRFTGGATPLDSQILSALNAKHVVATVTGPQVLTVSVSAPNPNVATGTLAALLSEFTKQENATTLAQAKAAASYDTDLVASASKAASDAESKVTAYLALHPSATSADPTLATLTQAATAADTKLADANNNLSQATIDLNHQSDTAALQTLDTPSPGTAVSGGKKKDLLALFAGLFAGALISILGVVIIASRRKSTAGVHDVHEPAQAPVLLASEPRQMATGASYGSATAAATPPGQRTAPDNGHTSQSGNGATGTGTGVGNGGGAGGGSRSVIALTQRRPSAPDPRREHER